MGVRKFRSVEQMPTQPRRSRLDPGNLRLALGLASLASSFNPVRLVPGVGKYRSLDEALSARAKPIPGRSSRSHVDCYRRLEELVKAAISGGVTYYRRGLVPDEMDEAGSFDPAPNGVRRPRIVIYRLRGMNEPGDVLDELLTLAHEFGHFCSFDKGLRTPEYDEALRDWREGRDLTRAARTSVLDEERRAWRFAREILGEVGFSDWDAFWRSHQDALADYRRRLRLDPDLGLTASANPRDVQS